jgi:hypothetical protein
MSSTSVHPSRPIRNAIVTTLALIGVIWASLGVAPAVGWLAGESTSVAALPPASEAAVAGAASLGSTGRTDGGGAGDLATGAPAAPGASTATGSTAAGGSARPVPPDLTGLSRLPGGEFLVGADARSLAPDPERWQTEGCSAMVSNFPEEVTHLAARITEDMVLPGWPKSPDCIYLGGYGLGPSRPATGVDPVNGYEVQTLAIANGDDVVIWQQTPHVGFFSTYRDDLCDACGILDIRRQVSAELGIPLANVAIGSNHSHGGADGYGAWGGLPTWYREQVRDVLIDSAYAAVAAMRPAAIAIGDVDARAFSRERRSTYQSVQDFGAVWMQARALPGRSGGAGGSGGAGEVIATVVNFAAHPTVLGAGNLLLHGDWPTAAGYELGRAVGGVGIVYEGGLGNVTPRRPTAPPHDLTGDGEVDAYDNVQQMGIDFAATIAASIERGGHLLPTNEVVAVDRTITHPVTNWTETALSLANLLDREFFSSDGGSAGGFDYRSEGGTGQTRPCVSAAPFAIHTQLSAFRIGDLTVVTAPGEIFSSISMVAKAKLNHRAFEGGRTMVFGQTQDSLGYIIPVYEQWPPGGVSAGTGGIEYEETFMLDRCFGDHVLDTMLEIGDEVWQ